MLCGFLALWYILGTVKISPDVLDVPQTRLTLPRECAGRCPVQNRLWRDVQQARKLSCVDQRRLELTEQPKFCFHDSPASFLSIHSCVGLCRRSSSGQRLTISPLGNFQTLTPS